MTAFAVLMYVAGLAMMTVACRYALEARHHARMAKIYREADERMYVIAQEHVDKVMAVSRDASEKTLSELRALLCGEAPKKEAKPS